MTPDRYAFDAAVSLHKQLRKMGKCQYYPNDFPIMKRITKRLEKATHFVIPDNMTLFDGPSPRGQEFHKNPYPLVTVGCNWVSEGTGLKYLFFAEELTKGEFINLYEIVHMPFDYVPNVADAIDALPEGPLVHQITFHYIDNQWIISPFTTVFPVSDMAKTTPSTMPTTIIILPDQMIQQSNFHMTDEQWGSIMFSKGIDQGVYSNFLKAVTHPDVQIKSSELSINRQLRRLTKFNNRVLTITDPIIQKIKVNCNEQTHTKRPHPRRGHYRTHSSGKRVWVSPCEIHKNETGFNNESFA